MTQPDYVPIAGGDRVRPVDRLPAPAPWLGTRPAELAEELPVGRYFGSAGSDLGYGLKLAKRYGPRLVLGDGDHLEDAIAGCFACGTKRSSLFGRAPVTYDMEWAYLVWGFLGDAPADLVAFRGPLFKGAAHHYWDQRHIVEQVRAESFALSPAQVRAQSGAWQGLMV